MIATIFRQYHPWALAVTLAVIGIFLDQLSKWFVLTHVFSLSDTPFGGGIGYANALTILPFFNVVTVWNYGVSFGLFHTESAIGSWVLSGIALVICFFLGWVLRKSNYRFAGIAIGMIWAGAMGNVIDRLRFGAVFDFLDFHYAGFHWPAFNFADILITCGIICYIIMDIFLERQR